MYIGMLWFDGNPKKSLANKVDDAVLYYREKYGKIPNTVQLHPSMLSGQFVYKGMNIVTNSSIMPNHLWLGVSERE